MCHDSFPVDLQFHLSKEECQEKSQQQEVYLV